jgi:hypothetical protein
MEKNPNKKQASKWLALINIPIKWGNNLLVFLPRQLLDETIQVQKYITIRFLSWWAFS